MQDKSLPLSITSHTHLERTISERSAVDWSIGNQEVEEKTLVGGEPASSAEARQNTRAAPDSPPHRTVSSKRAKQQREQPLAHIYPQMGTAIHQALLGLGGSNAEGGVQTILEALVEVAAPPERMRDLFALGLRRLEQRQELYAIPNPTGYLIGIMRKLAGEALVKGWDVAQMRAEDEEKHAQTLRSAARAGCGGMKEERPPDAGEASVVEQTALEEQASAAQTGDDPSEAEREAAQRAAEAEARYYASLPIDPHARQIWASALERIRAKVSQSAYTTWFSGTKGLALEDETLIVQVGSSFSREHLEQRFSNLIASAVSEQRGSETAARFIVIPDGQEDN